MHSCAQFLSFSLCLSPSLLYTHKYSYSHTHTHTAWICFLCDERDYGIKEARPRQFSLVRTKAALCGSTMRNTDECRAAHWRSAQPVTPRLLYNSNTRVSDCDSEAAAADLLFFRVTGDQREHRSPTATGSRAVEVGSPECWNGSIASREDFGIGCFLFPLQSVLTEALTDAFHSHTL